MYEITLRCAPPPGLTAKFPTISWHSVPTVTVLSRRVVDPVEIDELIERLRSLGITPVAIRAYLGSCEFRIQGRLSDSSLRYLQWTAHLDQERIVMHVSATWPELRVILNGLAESGIGIDHLVRSTSV